MKNIFFLVVFISLFSSTLNAQVVEKVQIKINSKDTLVSITDTIKLTICKYDSLFFVPILTKNESYKDYDFEWVISGNSTQKNDTLVYLPTDFNGHYLSLNVFKKSLKRDSLFGIFKCRIQVSSKPNYKEKLYLPKELYNSPQI